MSPAPQVMLPPKSNGPTKGTDIKVPSTLLQKGEWAVETLVQPSTPTTHWPTPSNEAKETLRPLGLTARYLALALALLTCLSILFVGIGSYPLYDPDEGRNAEVAREMVADGHWLPPTLNGEVRYQKPPLYYWMVASCFKLFGEGEAPARLPSALAALLCVLVTVALCTGLSTLHRGAIAGVLLSTSLIFVAYSHIVIFDMVLTLFVTSAIAAFYLGTTGRSLWPFYVSALLSALCFLTKGPVGLLLPAMAVGPLVATGRSKDIRVPWLGMALLFLALSVPPYALAELRYPGYCHRFFWDENVLRYLTHRYHRDGPAFYYLGVILAGLFPWTWLIVWLPKTVKLMVRENRQALILLGSWILLPTLFFSISHSKLPHYILPTFPAWAILLSHTWPGEKGIERWIMATAAAAILLYLAAIPAIKHSLIPSRSAANLVREASIDPGLPVFSFKAHGYSLSFYSNRTVKRLSNYQELIGALDTQKAFYLFTVNKKTNKALRIINNAGKRATIVGSSKGYTLILVHG